MLTNILSNLPHAAHARGKLHQVADVDFNRIAALKNDCHTVLFFKYCVVIIFEQYNL